MGLFFIVIFTLLSSVIIYQESSIRVGSEKITQKAINRAIYAFDFKGTPEDPDSKDKEELKQSVIKNLIEESVIRQEAKKRGISVSEEEVVERSKQQVKDYEQRPEIQKELTREGSESYLLKEKIKESIVGYGDGKYILIRFENNLGKDDAKYKEEKAEAKKYADDLYSRIKSGAITFEEAQKEVEAHSLFGKENFDKLGFSVIITGSFNQTVYENGVGIIRDPQFRSVISSTKPGNISAPSVLQVTLPEEAGGIGPIDGIYTIVKVNNFKGGETDNFEEWLVAKKDEYIKPTILESVTAFFKIPYAKAAWAGSCAGGLSTGSQYSGAGLFIQYYITAANGSFYALPRYVDAGGHGAWPTYGGGNVVLDSTSGNNFTWAGVSQSCNTAALTWENAPGHMEAAWIPYTAYLGYDHCGANPAIVLHCSCKDTYFADFGYAEWGGIKPENVYLEHAAYYHPNGANVTDVWWNPARSAHTFITSYLSNGITVSAYENPNIDPFYFNDIANGGTAGFNVYFRQKNNAPTPYTVSACSGSDCDNTFTVGTNNLTMVNLTAKATDPEGNNVAVQVAYRKTSATADTAWHHFGTLNPLTGVNVPGSFGTSSIPVAYSSSANNGVSGAKPATINTYGWSSIAADNLTPIAPQNTNVTFPALNLTTGTYEWAVRAVDTFSNYSGWVYGNFTVSVTPPTMPLSCTVTPSRGPVPLSVVVTVDNPIEGYLYNYDMDNDGNFEYLNRGSSATYVYPEPGYYNARVVIPGRTGEECCAVCTGSVTVTGSDSTGGEVAP